jgi:hypothetical protein
MGYKFCFSFIFSAIYLIAFTQSQNQSLQDNRIWDNQIYKQGINTVLIYKAGWELSMPVIELNSDDKIILSFDEIEKPKTTYYYTVIHCTPEWKKSDIESIDYIEGQSEGKINQVEFSQNTLVNYTNYTLEIPNKDLKIQLSGNYILEVFEDNPDKPVLTRRLFVMEPQVGISAEIEQLKVLRDDGLNQRVNFEINYNEDEIENPVENLSYTIIKNNELEKTFLHLKPSSIFENKIRFEFSDALSFAGGNEFRHIDLKNLKFLSDRLDRISKNNDSNIVVLKPDLARDMDRYTFENDLNGRKLIKLEGENKSHILADYCYVHFKLDVPLNVFQGGYYIFGSMTDYKINDEYRLEFNNQSGKYEKTLFLKQGYYNYIYLFNSPDRLYNNEADRFKIEGNHFQTENEYHILVYYKPVQEDYHKLVGYFTKKSTDYIK